MLPFLKVTVLAYDATDFNLLNIITHLTVLFSYNGILNHNKSQRNIEHV